MTKTNTDQARRGVARRFRWLTLVSVGVLAALLLAPTAPPEKAMAAGLTCGKIYTDGTPQFTHGCSGVGTIKYTAHCIFGQPYIFTHRWNTGGQNRIFNYSCSNHSSASSISYQIVG